MPSPTSQFCIYEFSKKFDNIQQKNGIWVSGGFEIDKTKAFFRSNYQSGDILAIPTQIRQAIIDGLFEIPNAYPPNPLSNEEFYQKVANRQLDIAHPQPEDIALIARELDDYCVLAVATRQMDNKNFRSKLVGYRYFWLQISELNPQYPYLVDGIATLLFWWLEKKPRLCFDMNPDSYENSHNKNQPDFGEQVLYKNTIRKKYKPVPKIFDTSTLPCLFEPTTDGQLDYFHWHAQALHLCNTIQKPAWAWNVRKLTKPETFTVVYCADRASYNQFFSPVLKSIDTSPTTGSITTSASDQAGSSHSTQSDLTTVDYSTTQPSSSKPQNVSNQDASDLAKYLKEVAINTESPSLRSLIELYQNKPPNKYTVLWRNSVNQELLLNNSKRLQSDIRDLTLVNVFICDIKSKGQSSPKSTDNVNFTEEEKKCAIDYLNELSRGISKYESQTIYKITVSKLKNNIANVRKSLSGDDDSPGENGDLPSDWPQFIIKLFIDLVKRPDYRLLIIPIIAFFFLFFVPPEINPLKPMINKISSVVPSLKERGSSKDANQTDRVQQLQAAREFIEKKSVTKECGEGGLSAKTQDCKIYTQTKNKLPKWPELPEPPQSNAISGSSPPKMLAKNRGQDNPHELVSFLQQSLKIAGAEKIGQGQFDETLENAVKEFQEKQTQCDLSSKNQNGQEEKDEQGNLIFDGQVGEKTWQCLSDVVQTQQVIAVLDYQIVSLKQDKTNLEIEEHIQKCKNSDPRNLQKLILPEDFIKCLNSVN